MTQGNLSHIEEVKRLGSQCPYGSYVGLEVEEVSPGYARVAATVAPHHRNWLGGIHGGWIASLADHAFSLAVNSIPGVYLGTQFSIQFLNSPRVGERLKAECRVTHQGRTLGAVEVRVTDRRGKLVAQGTALGIATRRPLGKSVDKG